MTIHVECEKCGYAYDLKDDLAGRKVKCKICQAVFVVPKPPEEEELSPAGSPIYRHTERKSDFELAIGNEVNIERIGEHITQHIGKVESVLHEILSDLVHIDIHWVAPTAQKPYHTLVTSGMSDRPMTVPDGAEALRFAELVMSLPPDWPMTMEAFKDERNYWPVRTLKMFARLPHEYETWLGWGHTVPNGEPAEPYADNTKLCCGILLSPILPDEGFSELALDGDNTIHFYSLVPLYGEEVDFKLQHGAEPLCDRLAEHQITELLNVKRVNACKKKGWW